MGMGRSIPLVSFGGSSKFLNTSSIDIIVFLSSSGKLDRADGRVKGSIKGDERTYPEKFTRRCSLIRKGGENGEMNRSSRSIKIFLSLFF